MKSFAKTPLLAIVPLMLLSSCGGSSSAPSFLEPSYKSQECANDAESYTVYYLDVRILVEDGQGDLTVLPSDFAATNASSDKVAATHLLRSSLPFNVSEVTGNPTVYTPNYESSYTITANVMYPAHIVFDFQVSAASVLYYKGAEVVYTVL